MSIDNQPTFLKKEINNKINYVSLTYDEINEQNITNTVKSNKAGAITSFIGITRDNFEDKIVTHLEYEAYNEMALEHMMKICDQVIFFFFFIFILYFFLSFSYFIIYIIFFFLF